MNQSLRAAANTARPRSCLPARGNGRSGRDPRDRRSATDDARRSKARAAAAGRRRRRDNRAPGLRASARRRVPRASDRPTRARRAEAHDGPPARERPPTTRNVVEKVSSRRRVRRRRSRSASRLRPPRRPRDVWRTEPSATSSTRLASSFNSAPAEGDSWTRQRGCSGPGCRSGAHRFPCDTFVVHRPPRERVARCSIPAHEHALVPPSSAVSGGAMAGSHPPGRSYGSVISVASSSVIASCLRSSRTAASAAASSSGLTGTTSTSRAGTGLAQAEGRPASGSRAASRPKPRRWPIPATTSRGVLRRAQVRAVHGKAPDRAPDRGQPAGAAGESPRSPAAIEP